MKKGKPEDFPHLNVPRPGVEPGRLAALVFETNASTNSATWAREQSPHLWGCERYPFSLSSEKACKSTAFF